MRQTERLTTLVSKLSTVRMIDELSLQLSAYARCRPILGQEQPARRARRDAATVLVLVAFDGVTLSLSSDDTDLVVCSNRTSP
jgi:hypothetical protein